MNAVSEIQPTLGTPADSTPGALLRQERELRGLTVQQVSEELHLDAWLVEALEQNRFLALGAPVYAKGHLRKYAVLLGLSPELILARYQAIAEPPPPLQLPPANALLTTAPMKRGFPWPRIRWPRRDWSRTDWRAYLIIAGVLLLSSSLWLFAYSVRSGSALQQTATSSAPTSPASPPSAAAAPSQSEPVTDVVPAAPTPAARVTNPGRTTTGAAPSRAAPAKSANPQVTKGDPRVAAVSPPRATTSRTTAAVQPAAPTEAPVLTPEEIPQVSLRLEFAAASWAEVYDADGRRLFYAQGDPNRPRTMSGKPPLKVTLGMAGSVQARVNGRPIAIPRRIGQDSASFTVGSNGAIR